MSFLFELCVLIPISGFFASSASSVVKSVLGKRMKIFDLQEQDMFEKKIFIEKRQTWIILITNSQQKAPSKIRWF